MTFLIETSLPVDCGVLLIQGILSTYSPPPSPSPPLPLSPPPPRTQKETIHRAIPAVHFPEGISDPEDYMKVLDQVDYCHWCMYMYMVPAPLRIQHLLEPNTS